MKLSLIALVVFSLGMMCVGCNDQPPKEEPPVPAPTGSTTAAATPAPAQQPKPKAEAPPAKPAAQPAAEKPAGESAAKPEFAVHGGIRFDLPTGWKPLAVDGGGLSAKLAFKLPQADGDSNVCSVRITHFPNMRGPQFDDMNIDRWIGQVRRPDGSPSTREHAKIETIELDSGVSLIVVDIEGKMAGGMGVAASDDLRRQVAAIVNHPNGPHFVKATGGVPSMAKAYDDIMKFLKSAKPVK